MKMRKRVFSKAGTNRLKPPTHWLKDEAVDSVLKFAVLTALFLGVHYGFERTVTGEHFKQFEAEILQTILSAYHTSEPLPIIVNISAVRAPFSVTDRRLLNTLIRKLDEKRVASIGIDVDFSPLDDGQPVTPDDWNYFDQWLTLTKDSGLRLHLGVHRRATDPPGNWLGHMKFAEMAVGMARPVDDPGHSFESISIVHQESDKLRQMTTALYEDVRGTHVPGKLLRESDSKGSIRTEIYRVNYSDRLLDELSKQTIDYTRPEDLDTAERTGKVAFRGKIVIIGDATGLEDQFCRPFSATPTAGAVAHAASLVTLREGGLVEIEGQTTASLDAIIAGFGCLLLIQFPTVARRMWATSAWSDIQAENAERLYCIFAAVFIGGLGVLIVHINGIFWPDFLWTSVVLLIHPFISETFFPFIAWIWSAGFGKLFGNSPEGAQHGK